MTICQLEKNKNKCEQTSSFTKNKNKMKIVNIYAKELCQYVHNTIFRNKNIINMPISKNNK